MRSTAFLIVVVIATLVFSGCGSTFMSMPQEFGQIGKQLATSIVSQADWTNIAAEIDGTVIEPGLKGEVYIKYGFEVRMVGVTGEVGVNATGEGIDGLNTEEQHLLFEQLLEMDEASRVHMLKLLGITDIGELVSSRVEPAVTNEPE